jgi:hypothetical protein
LDPVTVAAGVVALLAPYAAKAAEEFAGQLGQEAWAKARQVLGRVRRVFGGDSDFASALDEFEASPGESSEAFEGALASKLAHDESMLQELAIALRDVKALGPRVRVVQKVIDAERVTGIKARRMSKGDVDVDQHVGRATEVVGVELDDLG